MTNERFAEIKSSFSKPKISSQLNTDDIHKLRYWHYEQVKDLSNEEYKEYYDKIIERHFDFLKSNNLPLPQIWTTRSS